MRASLWPAIPLIAARVVLLDLSLDCPNPALLPIGLNIPSVAWLVPMLMPTLVAW